MTLLVRELEIGDRARWQELWSGYLTFYKTALAASQTELTWNRLLDPAYDSHCLVAVAEDQIIGITHYSFQNSTWAPIDYCYLEDLYVDENARGNGAGRALINAVKEIAERHGSSRLYWNTDSTNVTARKLYDSYTAESGKVQYRIQLSPKK